MSLRVLIADDNRDAAESLGVLLNLGGDEVMVVEDGSAAVQAARDWRPDLAVLDLVYRPSPTRLVRDARAIGARATAGASILLGQAWRSLELWLSVPAPVDAMREALRAELGDGTDA